MMRMEETTNQTRCLVQGISKPPRILMKSMVFRVDPLDFGVPNMCSLQTEGIHSESWTSPKDQLKNTCFAMFQPGKPSKSPRQNLRLGNRFSSTFGVYSYDITTYNHIIIYYMYMYHIHIYIYNLSFPHCFGVSSTTIHHALKNWDDPQVIDLPPVDASDHQIFGTHRRASRSRQSNWKPWSWRWAWCRIRCPERWGRSVFFFWGWIMNRTLAAEWCRFWPTWVFSFFRRVSDEILKH